MKEDNNFKKVYEKEAPDNLKESSLKNAQGSVSTMRSFFNVLDLYITKFFGAIIHPFKDNTHNNGFSTGPSFPFSMGKEDLVLEEEDMYEEDGHDEEDWSSDDDLPDDLIKS